MLSFSLGNSAWSVLIFPFAPVIAIGFWSHFLTAPCIISADERGLSIEVKRGRLNLVAGVTQRSWQELQQFKLYGGKGRSFRLTFADATINLSYGEIDALNDYLREYFPEKEKRSWW